MKQNAIKEIDATYVATQKPIQPIYVSDKYDALKTRPEAAYFLKVKAQTLAVWACNKRHPLAYIKVGRRVVYRQSDLDAFIESNVVGGHHD